LWAEIFASARFAYLAFESRPLVVDKVRDDGWSSRVEADHVQHATVVRIGDREAVRGHAHNNCLRVTKQVAVRPTIALLLLHSLVRQLISLAAYIPAPDGIAQTAAPTTQSIHILSKVEQMRADAADLCQVLECQSLRFVASVGSPHCSARRKGKDGQGTPWNYPAYDAGAALPLS
jgi:hypothetical protein